MDNGAQYHYEYKEVLGHGIWVGPDGDIRTEDDLIPVETVWYFEMVMEKVGSRCDLYLYEGERHGFFNYRNYEIYVDTRDKADEFLISTGIIRDDSSFKMGYPALTPSFTIDR